MNAHVYVALGSNMGDRMAAIERALANIDALEDTNILAVSSVVESEPWGVTDQPLFANAVARVATSIPADRFLEALKDIEAEVGRLPGERFGPRVIDLDILLFGDDEWNTPDLVVPHPRMAERDFAITPLLEVSPDVRWPDGSPVTRERATQGRVTRVIGPVPGFEDCTPVHVASVGGQGAAADPDAEWEPVTSERFTVGRGTAYAADLLYEASVLETEGIPVGWDPAPPAEEYNPWMLPRPVRLLVPPAFAARAREVLRDLKGAESVEPDHAASGDDDAEQ